MQEILKGKVGDPIFEGIFDGAHSFLVLFVSSLKFYLFGVVLLSCLL
jgi:hypothetical protein